MYYYLFVQFMIISNSDQCSVQKYKTCIIKLCDYNYTDLVNWIFKNGKKLKKRMPFFKAIF